MPSPSERHRNNIKAGVFVTISLILGLAVLVVLTDVVESFQRSTRSYTVTFEVASGVPNLKDGSQVRVGGVALGKVNAIRPIFGDDPNEPFRTIAVEFDLDDRVTLFADAQVLVFGPLIGADGWLEIPDVGDPSQPLAADGVIRGTPSLGVLTSLLGTENAGRADEIVSNATALVGDAASMVKDFREAKYPAYTQRLDSTLKNVDELAARINQNDWPNWADRVREVLQWAADSRQKLASILEEAHQLVAKSRLVVDDNDESVKTIVDNVRATTETVNTQTMAKVHTLLDRATQGVDHAVAVLSELKTDYGAWATSVNETLARANIAAQQLKLAMIEVRRAPWKVLYRPTSQELEHELLYEATRAFAVAAADLKASSESVERVLDQHGETVRDNPAFERLEQNLLRSIEEYEKAQQQLLDILATDYRK